MRYGVAAGIVRKEGFGESGASLRTACKTGVLVNSLAVRFTFASRKSGDIAFWSGKLLAVLFLFIIGDECHWKNFYKITEIGFFAKN